MIKVGRSKQTDENQIDLKQVADKQIQTTNSLQESFNNKQSPLVFNRELTKSTESTDTELDDDSIDFAITQDLLKEKEIFEWKLTWLLINAFIMLDPESILPYLELDPSFIEITKEEVLISVTPCLYFFQRRERKPRISKDQRLAYDALNALFTIKSDQLKARLTKNAVIILHQMFRHYNNPRHYEDKRLNKLHKVMAVWDVGFLMTEFFRNLSTNRFKYIKLNIENKNLRFFILQEIIWKYFNTLSSNISRKNLIKFIQRQLNPNKINKTNNINNNSITKIQSRKYHTQIAAPSNNPNRFWWSMFWGIRLICRIIFYIITLETLDTLWTPTPSNFRKISLDDFLNNMDAAYDAEVAEEAAWAAEDAAQDAYHAAGEQSAIAINNPEGIYNLSYFNAQEASGISTPNSQVSNNSYESDSEMETDMEEYVNSTDSDIKSNSDMGISSDSDSDNENDTNNPNSTSKSSTDFIPVIFFLTNKISWKNILFAISLIVLKIILNDIDSSLLLDLSIKMSDTPLIIDMTVSEYIEWFDSWAFTDKPLPPTPLDIPDYVSDSSSDSGYGTSIIPPIFFLRNKILDRIIKDILMIIYQHFLNLITSIITSRLKTLLTISVLGITITNKPHPKIDKGKGKEIIKDDSELDRLKDKPKYQTSDEDEYIYKSAEQIKLLARKLIQKDAEERMKLKNIDPNSSESEPIFKDPWETDPNRNLENPKFKMPWQIDPYRDLEDYKFPLPQETKNTKNQQSENTLHTCSDKEILILANHIINRHRAKSEESQQLPKNINDLDLQSGPKTESFYVIAPTPTNSLSKYSDSSATENNQLSTPMHLITPKTQHFSEYDFEIESNGESKPLNSKPEITNYKLKSENDREYTLTTTSRLKIEKNNNNEK
jgi:hypothetical protein